MARLTEPVGRRLLGLAPALRCEAGDILIRQGDTSKHVYLLRSAGPRSSACVKVTGILENGTESLLGIRVSGDLVGELATLRNMPRSATVVTCGPALVHRIPGEAFMTFMARHPDGWLSVTRMIADQWEWANRRRLDFAGYEVAVRLARVIVELVECHGEETGEGLELGVSLSQAELGKLIGAGLDAVGQAMRRLRAEGLVHSRYRRLTITKLQELKVFAELAS